MNKVFLIGTIFLLAAISFVSFTNAYNPSFQGGNPPNFGHSADELDVKINSENDVRTLQDVINVLYERQGAEGDITAVRTPLESGLEGGKESGNVTLSLVSTCSDGQVLKYNKTDPDNQFWECANDNGGGPGNVSISEGSAGGVDLNPNIITGTGTIALVSNCQANEILKFINSTWQCAADNVGGGQGGDNLGNHTAAQNIKLNGFRLSGDGDNEGILVSSQGYVSTSSNFSTGGDLTVVGGKGIYLNNVYKTDWPSGGADNLGNHTAAQNIKMGDWYLSNNGFTGRGIFFNTAGDVTAAQNLAVNGNLVVANTKSITLGGTARTTWPSTGFYGWEKMPCGADNTNTVTCNCTLGKKIIGGGGGCATVNTQRPVLQSFPSDDDTWKVVVGNGDCAYVSGVNNDILAYAICANT